MINQSIQFAVKGYGSVTSQVVAYLIIEKGVAPTDIHVFDKGASVGGCWVDANTHSETFVPVIGLPEAYYLPYPRIQRHLRGNPMDRKTMIHNLSAIHQELGFQLHLDADIVEEDETAKTITVKHEGADTRTYAYQVLISPRYRTMDLYQRKLSLRDGIREVDLSAYDRFKIVGNSMNAAESIEYIVKSKSPEQDYSIEIYYRNAYPILPRALGTLLTTAGLPTMWADRARNQLVEKFMQTLQNPSMMEYLGAAMSATPKTVGVTYLGGDFLFHPFVASKLKFIQYAGDVSAIEAEPRTLVVDCRNETGCGKAVAQGAADHLRFDMHVVNHPVGRHFVDWAPPTVLAGIGEAVWSTVQGKRPRDKYFRRARESVLNGEAGTCFWHYHHDLSARLVPFAYLFFPINTAAKLRAWQLLFAFLRTTGLITFFMNLSKIEREWKLPDEAEPAYFKLRAAWDALNDRTGMACPYPISFSAFAELRKQTAYSLFDIANNIGVHRRVKATWTTAAAMLLLTLGWYVATDHTPDGAVAALKRESAHAQP